MGARLSIQAPSAPTIAISSYVDILDNIQYVEMLNNSRFLKTIKAIDLLTGDPIIIKILIKPSNGINTFNIALQQYTELMAKEALLLAQFNCFLPTTRFIETDRAGYLIRLLVKTNLYDRLSIRPFLEPIEKKFVVFQLLKIMDFLHNQLCIRHGDLKLENIMVTSSNWIILADFASYLKPVYIPEDNPNQFSFYFDTSDRRVCNLAPERFYNSSTGLGKPQNFNDNDNFEGENQITEAMDLFALGCIIGELYLDGEPVFTLSGLFKYLKGDYSPDLSGINDAQVIEMVQQLILFDPKSRPSVTSLLESCRDTFFPGSFYDFLYDFMKTLNDELNFKINEKDNYASLSDLRVEYIYDNFDSIIKNLKLDYVDEQNANSSFTSLNLKGMPHNYRVRSSSNFKHTSHLEKSVLIILDFVFSLMNTIKQPVIKLKACELILALSERVNDGCKLDRSLPYLCKVIDDYIERSSRRYDKLSMTNSPEEQPVKVEPYTAKVVIYALDCIVSLLDSCSYLTPLNISVITEYLLPKLSKLLSSDNNQIENQLVKIKLASSFPYIAQTAHRFWLISKTFKIDGSKNGSSTYNGSVNGDAIQSPVSISKDILFNLFEQLTSLFLTDSNPKVRAALVQSIEPLCRFFGVDRTNDLVLPHLITYLNDSDAELKLTFLESIDFLGSYVGALSFEQYILPLLIQALNDSSQLVVLHVLKIFTGFVSLKLVNPASDLNALNIYKELLSNTTHLLLHPNEWIRQSVVELILAINSNLLNADRFCFLYPQIKSFLLYDITNIDWETVYPCLTKPLPKMVYQQLLNWSTTSSQKSLFWSQKDVAMTSPSKYITYSKDLGKSVFVPSNGSTQSFKSSKAHHHTPLTYEDKQWLLKLKAVGLEEKDLWKTYAMRSHILLVSKSLSLNADHGEESFLDVEATDIKPRNIFFDIDYKSEMVTSATKGSSYTIVNGNGSSTSKTERSDSNSLMLPNFPKVSASIQTVEENVFGELEMNNDHHANGHIHRSNQRKPSLDISKDPRAFHKVINANSEKVIISNAKHSYLGSNPYILRYLETQEFDLNLNSFSEFGDPVKFHTSKNTNWVPNCKCISQINCNQDPSSPDSLVSMAMSPLSEFFITGSSSGMLKLWDTQRLERNIMMKNPSLTAQCNSPVIKIVFMKNRDVFAVGTKDGKIRLFRVDVTRGKNKKIVKYSKFINIRKYELFKGEEPNVMSFETDKDKTMLVVCTTKCRIVCVNIITMEIEFEYKNPLSHGIPTCYTMNSKDCWLIVGTDKGRLCIWDTRFGVLVKELKVTSRDSSGDVPLKSVLLLPDHFKDKNTSYVAILGGVTGAAITIWEVPDFECREVLCPYVKEPTVKQYLMEEVKESQHTMSDILNDLTFNLEKMSIGGSTGTLQLFDHITGSYLVNSLGSGKIIFWNLQDFEKSISPTYSFTRTLTKRDLYQTNEKPTDQTSNQSKQDNFTINDIKFVTNPYELIVTVDLGGILRILT